MKGVRTLQEIPRLMDDHEFRKELERIQEHLDSIFKMENIESNIKIDYRNFSRHRNNDN